MTTQQQAGTIPATSHNVDLGGGNYFLFSDQTWNTITQRVLSEQAVLRGAVTPAYGAGTGKQQGTQLYTKQQKGKTRMGVNRLANRATIAAGK